MLPDRHIVVPEGKRIVSGYVPIEDIKMACRQRMALGDVEKKYREALQIAPSQEHPTPNGYWEGSRFVILDGRHTYIALLMLGFTHVLVSWVE